MPVEEIRSDHRRLDIDQPDSGDFALVQLANGQFILGTAPFNRSDIPDETGVSFYLNNFDLSDQKPWLIPNQWSEIKSVDVLKVWLKRELPIIKWSEPEFKAFKECFDLINSALENGIIVKSVPAAVSTATVPDASHYALNLALAARSPSSASSLYAFCEHGQGFVGLTPEQLLQMDSTSLKTMALASTAETGCGDFFERDKKEQKEHLLVVEALRRRLSTFGSVLENDREILDVGGMIHFLTKFNVDLEVDLTIDAAIQALHPTPAVGTVPRSEEAMVHLDQIRTRLGVPPAFGSPFGIKIDDYFEAFVAIRGIFFDKSHFYLPTGCGIVEGSELDREWDELELKRRWVKNAFGLT